MINTLRRTPTARILALFLAAAAVSGVFLSCSDEPNATGFSLIPDTLQVGTLVATTNGDTTVRVRIGGSAANLLAGKSGTYEAHTVMEFLFPAYNAAAVIDSAVVSLRVRYLFPDTAGFLALEAHAMNRTWSPTTFTWDSVAGSYDAERVGVVGATVTPADTVIRFRLDTARVRQWWQTGNVSLQLIPFTTSTVVAGFSNVLSVTEDTRPELLVSYHDTTADSLTILRKSPRVVFVANDELEPVAPALALQAGICRRAILRFDSLSVPPLASITTAVFEVAVDQANSITNAYTRDSLYVYLLRKAVAPYDSLALQIICTPVTEGGQKYYRGDVRAIVQQWISREPNIGLLLRSYGDFTTLDKIALFDQSAAIGLQPKIKITYTILPP